MEVEDSNLKEAFRMRDLGIRNKEVYYPNQFSSIESYLTYFVLMSDIAMITNNNKLIELLALDLSEFIYSTSDYNDTILRHIRELLKPYHSESLLPFTIKFIVSQDEKVNYAVVLIDEYDDFVDIFSRMLDAKVFTPEDVVAELVSIEWFNTLKKFLYQYNYFNIDVLYRILDKLLGESRNQLIVSEDVVNTINVLKRYLDKISSNV